MDADAKREMQAILAEEIYALEGAEFASLWRRFTEQSRGIFSRQRRWMAKGEEVHVKKGESGRIYDVEIGLSVEHERDLHFFVSVIDAETGESLDGDTVVKRVR